MALALVVTLLTGTACGSDGDPSEPAASDTPASTVAPTPEAVPPSVTLDDPGSEPRQALVLRVAPGTTAKVALESQIGLELVVDGNALPSGVIPATRTVLESRVDSVDPDGNIRFTATVIAVSVVDTPGSDPAVRRQVQGSLEQLQGLGGTGTVDAHNGSQTLTFDTSSVTDPTLKSTLDSVASQVGSLAAPFPREPVGTGARWTAETTATINGITMNTTTHYTLRSRTGDRYHLDFTQEASAPPGPATIPNLPPGTRTVITSFLVETTGELDGDLTRPLPTTSTATGVGDGTFTVSVGAEEATLVEHLTTDFTLSPG